MKIPNKHWLWTGLLTLTLVPVHAGAASAESKAQQREQQTLLVQAAFDAAQQEVFADPKQLLSALRNGQSLKAICTPKSDNGTGATIQQKRTDQLSALDELGATQADFKQSDTQHVDKCRSLIEGKPLARK